MTKAVGGLAGTRLLRSRGLPYYVQVADHLRKEIRSGRWAPGELITSEAGLCEAYSVSRTAIRQALAELVNEGLLHKEKGRGTFVSRPYVSLAVQETRGFFDELSGQGRAVSTHVLRQEAVLVPPAIAPMLGVAMGSTVACLERVRHVGEETFVLTTTYLPLPRFAALLERDMSRESLYAVLAEEFQVQARAGKRRIEAVTAADPVTRHLAVRKGSPLLRVTAVNVDSDDEPFEVFEAFYRGDRTVFEVDVASR